jgi:phosphohistidine swiveling domain-containing protein
MTTATAIEFAIPSDVTGFWQWDKMHCPRPQTPLTQEFVLPGWTRGFTRAMDEWSSPFGVEHKMINYYFYLHAMPLGDGSAERKAKYKETIDTIVPRVGRLWQEEWLPSILPGLEKARTLDYAAMSDQQLLDVLNELYEDMEYRCVIHGRINYMTAAASLYADFYNENFSPQDPTEPYQALQGFVTKSVEAGNGLWRLSRLVRSSDTLRSQFETLQPGELIAELEKSQDGQSFLRELRAYLDEYGWRSDIFELAEPSWRENPAIPLNAIQGYMSLGDEHDPAIKFAEAVKTRDALLARARERLEDDSAKLRRFEDLYDAAHLFLNVTEDHNFYIDQIGNTVMRLPILELGRRLVESGAINDKNDIFLLFVAELREAVMGKDQKALVAQRRAEIEKWSKVVPPPILGEPPALSDDPFEQGLFVKMFGIPPEPSRDPSVINGIPASAGTVQGRAKVVRTLAEASKLENGDVLVCEMTMPPWTPLFSTVSAVVADTGGILSHCAIVAREYRMPCVVGTAVGTALIKDGMLITVDGSKGIVRIEG